MRMILLYILLLALSSQLSAVSLFLESENLKTSESEKWLKANDESLKSQGHKVAKLQSSETQNPSQIFNFSDSQIQNPSQIFSFSDSQIQNPSQIFSFSDSQIQNPSQIFSFSDSQILYYESQIHIADSLYKNYLPQYNFEEVKAAMEFFDSFESFLKSEKSLKSQSHKVARTQSSEAQSPSQIFNFSDSQILYLQARAHYYHAVGLTERDDIVGACEHYFIALEIMETETENLKTSKSEKRLKAKDKSRRVVRSQSNEAQSSKFKVQCSKFNAQGLDYEKIRFLALTYTRLGRLFYNENYCDLAILKYKKALKYVEMLDEKSFKANVLKELGNSYQLSNKPDSAMYYYNESLRYNSSLPNKLDVEKSIAQILFYEGERDSAYMLLKNNLYKINNDNVKYSYHYIIGDLFYHDKKYDSALYYLEESLDYSIINKRIAYTTKLSTIYDSLGDYEKRNYYDNISSKLFKDNVNKEVANKRIQVLYNNFKERNNERERNIAKVRVIKLTTAISLSIFVIVTSLLVLIRYKYKRRNDMLSEEINAKAKYINDNEFRYSLMEGKIKSKNAELHQKEEQIKSQQSEIAELRNSIGNKKNNLKEYCRSEICIKIFNRINELSKSGKDTSELKSLSQEEFVLLLQSAKQHLSLFFENISSRYPSLKKEDLYYLCLNIINLNDKQIAALFGVTYQAIRTRRKKICVHLGINMKENLHNFFIP